MCSCIDGRWKLGKFIFPVKHSFITWSPSQRIELQQSCTLYIHAALQFREYMNTGIKYYWMSLNITVLATNLRLVMKPASFLSFLVFVACSMKFVQNFILQATNAQCLGTRLNETHIEASYNGEPGHWPFRKGWPHQLLTFLKPKLNAWRYNIHILVRLFTQFPVEL